MGKNRGRVVHKAFLQRMAKQECRARGIDLAGKGPNTLISMISELSGIKMPDKATAYLWVEANLLYSVTGQPIKNLPKWRPTGHGFTGSNFYEAPEWRAVRFEALKASDGRCCLCGRSKRTDGVTIHVDHIKPRSIRPDLQLDPDNLQVLCEDCNMGKSNRDETDWR